MTSGEWTVDANEALRLSLGMSLIPPPPLSLSLLPLSLTCSALLASYLNPSRRTTFPVRAKDDTASLTPREAYEGFHPTFTYPVRPSPPPHSGAFLSIPYNS